MEDLCKRTSESRAASTIESGENLDGYAANLVANCIVRPAGLEEDEEKLPSNDSERPLSAPVPYESAVSRRLMPPSARQSNAFRSSSSSLDEYPYKNCHRETVYENGRDRRDFFT